MAEKKSKKRAAVRRSSHQPDERSAPPPRLDRPRQGSEPNPFASAKTTEAGEAKRIDEDALTREVITECRTNLTLLKEAGELLDRMYSRGELAQRRELYFERRSAPKEVEYDITAPDGSKRRVRRAADYGGDSWACQRDWPEDADATKQLMSRLFAALNDVMDGWFHYDVRPTVDRTAASIVLLLHWVLTDESASSLKPQVCEFQSLPWSTGKTMRGRRTVATMWFDSAHKTQWYRRVKEALDWARLRSDWCSSVERAVGGADQPSGMRSQASAQTGPVDVVCVTGCGRITFRGIVLDFETPQQRVVISELFEANSMTKSSGAPIHESVLSEAADGGIGWSIRKTFGGHPAYKTILRPAKGKGMWALCFDDEAEKRLKEKERGQLGGQLRGRGAAKNPTRDRNKTSDTGRAGAASPRQRKVDPRRS